MTERRGRASGLDCLAAESYAGQAAVGRRSRWVDRRFRGTYAPGSGPAPGDGDFGIGPDAEDGAGGKE